MNIVPKHNYYNAGLGTEVPDVGINIPASTSSGAIVDTRHPDWSNNWAEWEKWRCVFEGGEQFKQTYLFKLSDRESETELKARRRMAYCPAFATAAINDVKNAIFQRISDVTREGGAATYKSAVSGQKGGVDLQGSSMGTFIGTNIIDELLVMAKVGVLVDNFDDLGITQADKRGKQPYLTAYSAENILSWAPNNPTEGFEAVLLREIVDDLNEFGLPQGKTVQYRLMRKTPEGILVIFYDEKGNKKEDMVLDIPKIPFVTFEVSRSLMKDAADYQIALLNLESSDIDFSRKANFPFYYEYYDPKTEGAFAKPAGEPNNTGTSAEAKSRDKEIQVGLTKGRRVPKGFDKPGFINPDPDTLRVSMEKGNQLKDDIRSIVNLNLMTLHANSQSAESKEVDNRSLEASLSFVGLVLQKGEQQIAEHWASFEGEGKRVKVTYPKTYSLKSEKDRREEADELDKLSDKVPSDTFRREVKVKMSRILMGGDLTDERLAKIEKEIRDADVTTSDSNIILSSHKAGLVGDKTAAVALGFKEEEIEQAKKDRAERIKLTMEAQGGEGGAARGVPELDKGKPDGSGEKDGKAKRGQEDNTNVGTEQK